MVFKNHQQKHKNTLFRMQVKSPAVIFFDKSNKDSSYRSVHSSGLAMPAHLNKIKTRDNLQDCYLSTIYARKSQIQGYSV